MMFPMSLTTRIYQWARNIEINRTPDFIIGDPIDPYMKRWWIIPRNRLFNIYLHRILKSDDDRAKHDHPWASMSLILGGRYVEALDGGDHERLAGDIVFRRAITAHRLIIPPSGSALSLFITGPTVRTWGFHCSKGWIPWQEFCEPTNKGQIGRGCE